MPPFGKRDFCGGKSEKFVDFTAKNGYNNDVCFLIAIRDWYVDDFGFSQWEVLWLKNKYFPTYSR